MIALSIALCSLLALSMGGAAWLGVKLFRAVDDDGDRRVAITALENEIEIARYENERLTAVLEDERKRANAIEKQISDEINRPYSGTANSADTVARIRLYAEQWRAITTKDGHDPGDSDALPVDSPTE